MLEAEEAARDSALTDTNFYEVTIASVDQPKLLSRLSEALVSLSSFLLYPALQSEASLLTIFPQALELDSKL